MYMFFPFNQGETGPAGPTGQAGSIGAPVRFESKAFLTCMMSLYLLLLLL